MVGQFKFNPDAAAFSPSVGVVEKKNPPGLLFSALSLKGAGVPPPKGCDAEHPDVVGETTTSVESHHASDRLASTGAGEDSGNASSASKERDQRLQSDPSAWGSARDERARTSSQAAYIPARQFGQAPIAVSDACAEASSSWAAASALPNTSVCGALASPANGADQPSRPVGPRDFEALREIGEGAFGKVYLVRYRKTGRLYAMKVLSKQTVLRKEQVAYAMSERDVMCSLEHPYLVSLRFSFQTQHRLFLVMDYLEGGHLWLQMKSGFFSEDVARVFTAEIVLAIGHLHSLNIAHRDLKPENILLDSSNHLRLTDFGLAKKEMDAESRANTMVGTIDYMSPEVVKNEGHGKAVDWWSLGVLLYEMLFARLPFAPMDRPDKKGKARLDPSNELYKAEVKRRIIAGKVVWPKGRFVNPVSKVGKDLILKLLTRIPTERLGANGAQEIMAHPFFRGVDWEGLMARKVPSPLASSIFRGAPDKIGTGIVDPVPHPHDVPCPKLAGYLFEKDTPPESPHDMQFIDLFRGFSYVQPSEFMRQMSVNGNDPFAAF